MDKQQEIAALEAELAALEAEGRKAPEKKYGLSTDAKMRSIDPYPEKYNTQAWAAKTAAKAAVSPLNLPVALANAAQWARGAEQITYPSEKVGEAVDTLTSGRSKAKPGFQETVEPYAEALLSMPFGGGAGKALQLAGKGVGAVAPLVGKGVEKVGNFVGAGTAPTVRNAAANVGTLYGARHASEQYSDAPWAPIVGGVVGGIAGRAGATTAKGIAKTLPALRDVKAKAALRQPTIGGNYLEDVTHDLGGKEILGTSAEKAGEVAQRGVGAYKVKANELFNNLEKRVHAHAKDMRVSAEKPLAWAAEKYSELTDPILQNAFMKSPLGIETKRIMGLPLGLNSKAFRERLKKDPSLLTKDYTFADVLRYRRNIDNSLSSKAWNQIGNIDEGELKNFRGLFSESIGDKFAQLGAIPASQWRRYNKNYEKYAVTKIPKVNAILADKHEPTKSYRAASEGMGDLHSNADFTLSSLKGKDRQDYALALVRDLGKIGEKFDLHKFSKNFYDMEGGMQRKLLGALSPEMRKNVHTQLQIGKGVNNVVNQQRTFGDLLYRTSGLSLPSRIKKVAISGVSGRKYSTPEGRKILTEVAMRNADRDVSPYVKQPGRIQTAASTLTRNAPLTEKTSEYDRLLKEAQSLGIDTDNLS